MRIAFLNPIGDIGGAERSLLAWMAATRQAFAAAELTLVLPDDSGALAGAAREIGVKVKAVAMPAALARMGDSALIGSRAIAMLRLGGRALVALPALLLYIRRLRRALREIQPDLIHSNGIKTHLLARLVLLRWRMPPGVTWHIHDFVGQRPLMARALRWAARPVTVAVAVSEAVAKDARLVLPRMRIDVVYNVTDVERFSPQPMGGERLDELAGLPTAGNAVVRIVLVATYARWKGHDVFLRAAASARSHSTGVSPVPPLRFFIVGGPIYRTAGSQFSREELDELAEGLGLGSTPTTPGSEGSRDGPDPSRAPQNPGRRSTSEPGVLGFIAFQPDPIDVYRAADIVVHASTRAEPFGLTIIEAMACGKPVIVSQAGGAAELFTDGEDALGVPPGDAEQLAAAIVKLAQDADLRRRLGARGRQTVLRRFDQRLLPQAVSQFYRQLGAVPLAP